MANTFVFDDDEPQPDMNAPASDPGDPEQPEGGEGNNRTFLFAAIGLGAIVLLSLICMAVYALLILPGQQVKAKATSDANLAAIALATNVSMETQAAVLFTATMAPSETPAPLPTETLVVVFATPTVIVAPTTEPATATFEAMQTTVANNILTAAATSAGSNALGAGTAAASSGTKVAGAGTPAAAGTKAAVLTGPEATAAAQGTQTSVALGTPRMPSTGFADEVGLPGLFVISIILVAVILLARRMRQTPMAR